MVAEVRNLLFSDGELLEAMAVMMRKRGERIPGPQPVKIRLVDRENGKCQLWLDFQYDKQSRVFELEEAVAAMTAFCIRLKIPMPRDAAKSIELRGSSLALVISIQQGRAAPGQRAA